MTGKKELGELERLWELVRLGRASEEEKIEAAWTAGEAKDATYLPNLVTLLSDSSGEVRYYALQTLVLDLQQVGPQVVELSWRLLRNDPDEEVRAMAASCLGKIYFNTDSLPTFRSLTTELKSQNQPSYVKGGIYSSLFKLAGRPPADWPGLQEPRRVFRDSDIDWQKVAELEDEVGSRSNDSG